MKIEISFPVDIEDVIQPSGFHQIVSLLEDNFISNFPKEKVHVTFLISHWRRYDNGA